MFEFSDVNVNPQATEVHARCFVSPNLRCFMGHFDGHPILPAVVILNMLNILIDAHTDWRVTIEGGKALKFLEPIVPGDEIRLALALQDKPGRARFEITHHGTLACKGECSLRSDSSA